ncbi:hypothetical protein [Dyadobacter jiangsuensis]|uniref:Uncharacterized protein n=1 Tax=Dyadobacter jiangsuensis TaxID=1591085 RepID=A0A2P8G0F9_9BACT|nr:hypothetical protein [Dyadobacter jiangsuensis]PSL27451.1 hypothetical protein CLV60_108309 [Dyadobacter jiangsuensis]
MSRFIYISALIGIFFTTQVVGQESIYLANGNRSTGKLVGATHDKVKISVSRPDKVIDYYLRRENVMLAFNEAGQHIVIADLSPDPAKATQQITDFNRAIARKKAYDIIIRANPAKAFPGLISYESDDVINYQTQSGAAASINKREVAVVLYRNGQHKLLTKTAEIVPVLKRTHPEVQKLAMLKIPAQKGRPAPKGKVPVKKELAINVPAPPPAGVAKTTKPTLTEEEYKMYRTKSLQTVDEFVGYLNKIANEEAEEGDKETAIKEALKLFLPDAMIEVTSLKNPGVRRIKIKEYLTRLKMNVYGRVAIEWNEIQYVKELKKEADGSYYGVISGQQTFIGYSANGKDVLYTDVTEKDVNVKLESYKKTIEGKDEDGWKVLLGNIGVSSSN